MQRYILKRGFYALISLIILSITIFCLIRFTGDPAILMVEPGASDADLQAIRKEFGLDKPWPIQYGVFVMNMVRGNFGMSIGILSAVRVNSWLDTMGVIALCPQAYAASGPR